MDTIYQFSVEDNKGQDVSMDKFKGDILLIVNTATACGFTPQYEELEKIYRRFQADNFFVLDFPCNQFGGQAPGSDEEIQKFCTLNYKTDFPRFHKLDVVGPNADPLFVFLGDEIGFQGFDPKSPMTEILTKHLDATNPGWNIPDVNNTIKWNFTKFLINRKGEVVARFEPTTPMDEVEKAVYDLIKAEPKE